MRKKAGAKGGTPQAIRGVNNPMNHASHKPTWIAKKAHNKPIDEERI